MPQEKHNPQRRSVFMGGTSLLAAPWLALAPAATASTPSPSPALVLRPRPLVFPRDHGTHNDTRTEWWYLTGHAQDAAGRAFGFQVTFFRSRVDGTHTLPGRLAARQLLFAHAAITDVQAGKLWHDQRIARWNGEPPAPGLPTERGVFASAQDTHVVLRDWSIQRQPNGAYATRIQSDQLRIDLHATPTQPLLLQGDNGFSRKGPDPAQASFYVTQPQLAVQGQLAFGLQRFQVQGTAWLDHEWSEALLHPDAVGWDWIGMNLFNGDSLTAFRLRRADGSALWAGGSWRSATASTASSFEPHQVKFTPLRHWISPRTRARYPVEWRIQTPDALYTVKAVIDPQELDSSASTGTVYWEGLSDLLDQQGQPVGRGYLEMTGYAQRLVL
ncbi:MAG: carotenoid 1,2-hydratase [Hydrogenophaga sp.]|uniref:lipocalin-like domain-containing protein n=1 Tax=Hydrogenophaga sp. TaxID=1904254 RepID=UPI00271BA04C|nr:carotenoid 1,2-hydratase [Hydrogenophaga sp.]MDO9569991.1 carotenoid 1,2-hydratase [Hydrogenophaga sp.]